MKIDDTRENPPHEPWADALADAIHAGDPPEEATATKAEELAALKEVIRFMKKKPRGFELNQALDLFGRSRCFQDQRQEHYIEIIEKDRRQTLRLDSKAFQQIFAERYHQHTREALNETTRRQMMRILHGQARLGPRLRLSVRMAEEKEGLLLDMGTECGHLAVIHTGGWEILRRGRPQFLQPPHMLTLPKPVGGQREIRYQAKGEAKSEAKTGPEGEGQTPAREPAKEAPIHMELLRELMPQLHEMDWQGVLAWLTGTLHPGLILPMLCLIGPQGSGKTTMARILRRILDPSTAETMALPTENGMLSLLQDHAIPIFDNAGRLNTAQANMLCRAVTGNAKSLTDGNETAQERLRRPLILTALELPSLAPDWLDRAWIIDLAQMENGRRIPESGLWPLFDTLHAQLLAAALDLTSATLAAWHRLTPSDLPRMADFATWGMASMAAQGQPAEQFLACIERNGARLREAELEANPMASAILEMLERAEATNDENGKTVRRWEGGMEDLLEQVPAEARPYRTAAGRKLRTMAPLLGHFGLRLEFQRNKKEGKRTIKIEHRMTE